jgi:RNA:NAD 2'-phosphotransferase (TPT1/KptA family)
MTDEEIHNIYLHMSGKAEGLVEATGKADFPVMFARAILDYKREWVPLTAEEREQVQVESYGKVPHHVALIAAVEAKLEEKNT